MAESGSLVKPLCVNDLCVVQEELYVARTHWYDLGLKLGLKPDVLDTIMTQCSEDPSRCFRDTMKDYLKTVTPSWRALVEALRGPIVDQPQLADKVEKKYCSPETQNCDEPLPNTKESSIPLSSPAPEVTECELHSFAMQISTSSALATDEQHLPKDYGCGCGECSFKSFFEKGCPKPTLSMSSFSYLNTEGLDDSQKQILRGRLYREFEVITTDFGNLVYNTCESLIKQGITVQELVRLLMTLGAFQPALCKRPLLEECIEELQAADNIDKVFLLLRGYMSFFSYHIIEYIICKFGDQQDKENLCSYTAKFNEYSRRGIFECPTYSLARKDQANLIVKLEGVNLEEYNLTHLAVFKSCISNIIKVTKYTLRLCTVEKGCLQLIFQVPHFVKEVIFPLTDSQKAALKVEGVTLLTCEDYQCPLENSSKAKLSQKATLKVEGVALLTREDYQLHKAKNETFEVKLETDGLFSPSKPEGLIEIAKDVNRHDLASEVEKFIKSQRKSASKEEKKAKQQKSPPQAAAESVVDLHLKCNFEATLTQTTVLMKQVDILLQRAITEGKGCRRKVKEAMKEARQTADRLAETLQKAQNELETDSDSDRWSDDLSPLTETSRHMLPVLVQSLMASRDPATPTPKPRRPRKCAQEGLAGPRAPVQEMENSAQSTASYVANAHLQASTSGSHSEQIPIRWIVNEPQSAPNTPSMERVNSQHTIPAVPPRNRSLRSPASTQLTSESSRPPATSPMLHRHTMFQHADSSNNYAHLEPTENEELEDSTAGTGDSGYSEAEQWKGYMQHPPPRPPIPETSRHRLPVQVQSPTVSDPATPTPKPRIPRKCAQEGLASLRAPVQETGNSAQSTASYVAKAHLRAATGGSPKPARWVRCPGLTNKPQSAPSTPLMERVTTQRTKPAVPPRNLSLRSPAPTQLTSSRPPAESPPVARLHHHAMLEHADSSDNYAILGPAENEETEGCTGDDSGFSEAKQWTKHMQHLPDSPEQIHYYKSLNRSEIKETSYEDIQH